MSSVRVSFLILAASCSTPPKEASGSPLRGRYTAYVTVDKYTNCADNLEKSFSRDIDFDTSGNAVSPLPEVVKCATSFLDPVLRVTCNSPWGGGDFMGTFNGKDAYCGKFEGKLQSCELLGHFCLRR